MKKTIILILFLKVFLSFSQEIKIPIKDLKIKKTSDTLFLKRINYFNYKKDNFLIDTLFIKENYLIFKKKYQGQSLYQISSSKNTPITFIPLRENPEVYYYMFCSNFYLQDNYLLLENNYDKFEFEFLKIFYKDFSKKSFDRKLYKGGGYKDISITDAEKKIITSKKLFYKKLKKSEKYFSKKFITYIKTEIELGSTNQFLNWYEEIFKNSIDDEFSKIKKSIIHEKYYHKFLNKKWNSNSIQYFKIIERYVNYLESKNSGTFKIYNKETEQMRKERKLTIDKTVNKN